MLLRTLAALSVALPACAALGSQPPATPKKPVVDTLHGVQVTDDYRWLEDWSDAGVKAWSESQNKYAREVLDKLPAAPAIRARMTQLEGGASVDYSALAWKGGKLFAIKHQPPKQQPFLVTLASADDTKSEKTLVDPNVIDAKGLTAIDWFVPSPDGKLVAVSLSEGGSESGTVHVFDVATGKEAGDIIPRAHGGTAGGSLAWAPDNSGFYYTRYPRATDTPPRSAEDMDFFQQVYFHKLGTKTEADTYEIGKDFPKIAEIILESSKDGRVLASVQKGDGGEFIHCVKQDGKWTQLTQWDDKCVCATLGEGGSIILVSNKNAPRGRVLVTTLKDGLAGAKVLVPEAADGAVVATDFAGGTGLLATGDTLYVWYQTGGPNQVRTFGTQLSKSGSGKIDSPPISSIGQVVDLDNGKVLYASETFLTPSAWYEHSPSGASRRTALFQTSPADYSDCEVVREFATSKDGTKVPLNIIRKKGLKLPAPTIVWGYGGYGINEAPTFSPRRRVFVEQGGIFVVANIRGGGEYGEEWHRAGNLTNKQNVFDDFYAAAKYMIDKGYTTKDKLAIMGGSNGGLLMGATFTQHPDLCAAVLSSVGIYDMLRVELSSNGAFNVTEFGTVKDPAQFKALLDYSPYHHVKDGTTYPAILMLTGANDPRVDPMQSRKMIARLQAADTGGTFLLRTSANAGHGIGSSLSERIEQSVDTYAFLFDKLGVKYVPVK